MWLARHVGGRSVGHCCRWYSVKPEPELGGTVMKLKNMARYEDDPEPPQKTLRQLLQDKHQAPEETNIGLEYTPPIFNLEEVTAILRKNRSNKELEATARHQQLKVPLADVQEQYFTENGPSSHKTVLEHYGIYRDLFAGATFYPVVPMAISYDYSEDEVTPVYRGNYIPPSEACKCPRVSFEGDDSSLYTLVMTNPDGHLQNNDKEYLHWAVGNIERCDVEAGDLLCPYLQPFPAHGTGFQRHVFLLFKQRKRLDFSPLKSSLSSARLDGRSFSTHDFYGSFKSDLCPVGASFFQSEWDESVTDVYHKTFKMKEPHYEYLHPTAYHPQQKTYPGQEAFNRYFDRYRDKKELMEEVVKMKLEMISPFKENDKQFPYPNIVRPLRKQASWIHDREEVINRRIEQFKDLPK